MQEELKNLNQKRLLEQRVIERTQSMKNTIRDLDAFTYTVSHDLRSPLRGIYNDTYMIKETSDLSSDAIFRIGRIMDNLTYMERLIQDLLRFSRMSRQKMDKSTIDMNCLVEGVVTDLIDPQAPQATITIGDLPPAFGDYTLIRQVMVNLISNAIKFRFEDRQK